MHIAFSYIVVESSNTASACCCLLIINVIIIIMNTYFPEPSLVLASMFYHFEPDNDFAIRGDMRDVKEPIVLFVSVRDCYPVIVWS
jgi:hypothetical protein